MKLNKLLKLKGKGSKRLGRGVGSGKGKTSGRGTKGQKVRGKMPVSFGGGGLPLYKKLPLRRGLGNSKVSAKLKVLTLDKLNVFKSKSAIDLEQLLKANLINKKDMEKGVKILAGGKLSVSLLVKLPVSKKAQEEIIKSGGKVENA